MLWRTSEGGALSQRRGADELLSLSMTSWTQLSTSFFTLPSHYWGTHLVQSEAEKRLHQCFIINRSQQPRCFTFSASFLSSVPIIKLINVTNSNQSVLTLRTWNFVGLEHVTLLWYYTHWISQKQWEGGLVTNEAAAKDGRHDVLLLHTIIQSAKCVTWHLTYRTGTYSLNIDSFI